MGDTFHVGGRASSNESMSQSDETHVYRSGGRMNIQRGTRQNEDLEASYMTSVSKNPILLRKTESLKLDSVQSLRNRFNRISSNNTSTLTRNPALINKNLDTANDPSSNYSNNNSNENLNSNHIPSSHVNGTHNNIENEPPPPPTLIISPMLRSHNGGDGGNPLTPTPLITSAGSIASSTSSVSGPNGHSGLSNYSEYFGLSNVNGGSMINTNGVCVKKRVWTPVQSSPNTKPAQNVSGMSNTSHQFAEVSDQSDHYQYQNPSQSQN